MSGFWHGAFVALITLLVLAVLVSAGGRALDPIGLAVFVLVPVATGVFWGRRRARERSRARVNRH